MPLLRLPRTHGCLVCGRDNARGLQLELFVDDATGIVSTEVVLADAFIGFTNVIHGGVIATIFDEAMVWAATWAGKRFCLCGELNVRYLLPASPGVPYRVEARIDSKRSRLITTTSRLIDASGREVATATAKYLPVSAEENAKVVQTFVEEPVSAIAATQLIMAGAPRS